MMVLQFPVLALAPVGTLLFVALTAMTLSARTRPVARVLLVRGSLVGGIGAALAGLAFATDPDLRLPGAGTWVMVLAVFLAVFAVAAGAFAVRLRR